MTKIRFVILSFVCGCISIGHTQHIQKITLQSAVTMGVENSTQLMTSHAKLTEAQARVREAKDRFLPDVGVSGSYIRVNTPNIKMSEPSDNNNGSDPSPLSAFSNLHSLGLLQVTASEPIFNGFKLRHNKTMTQYLEEAARYDVETTKNAVALNTMKAVYQYYELLETRNVVEENLKQAEQRAEEFRNLERNGVLPRNDRLRAELQANSIELGLTEVNNNVQMAEYNLIILLGMPEDTQIVLDTAGIFEVSGNSTWEECLQQGLENRNELKSVAYKVKASEMSYKMVKADRLPSLGLSAGLVNAYLPNVVTINNALNAGLSLRYSITGALHASHKMREVRAQMDQVDAAQKEMGNNIRMEIKQKFLKYRQMQDKLEITDRAIAQAQENFTISENKYKNGLLLLSDYLDANTLLLESKLNYATTHANAMVAYYELQQSIGNLK
ncbi:MAG: TolC family protein [Cyclobacteriaceae bacterium]|nr:TolC family protein [Cyclobacteriaceae bacterium]